MASGTVPPIDDISTLPQPTHITLLFRHHKSVTLLSVSPNQSFSIIKNLLLSALKSRNITSLHNSSHPADPVSLPASPADLEFGVLIDKRDSSKGWTLLTPDSTTAATSTKKKSVGSKADADTPAGAGLADGSWVAFRVRKAPQDGRDEARVDENGDVDVEMDEDQGWDVVLPTFEEEEEGAAEDDARDAIPN